MTRASSRLAIVAIVAGVACAPRVVPAVAPTTAPQPEGWDDGLRIAEAIDLDPAPDVVLVDIEARLAPITLRDGVVTEMWTYNGQVPGPTIRARRGDRVIVRFRNALPEPTSVHWHGLRVEAAMDGIEPIVAGASFEYILDVPDACTYWYHPHVDSSAQLGDGLYGAFIVTDDSEPALGDELVLVLSDVSLDDDGVLLPGDHQGWFGDFFGREGVLALVNGREAPSLLARAGLRQRWRIINASRARYDRLGLPGHDFVLVGVDGGLLDAPIADATVTIPPGARADVVFAPRDVGVTVAVDNLGIDRFHVLGNPLEPTPLFRVDVTADAPVVPESLPSALRVLDPVDVTAAPEQRVVWNTALAPDGNTYFAINGELGDAEPFTARTNTTEVWTLKNDTTTDHPFHLHGFFFQVLDVDGVAPTARGWFDTVNLEPRQVMRIAIPFDDRAGMWMFHCHILDHADRGMMRMLMLIDDDEHDHE